MGLERDWEKRARELADTESVYMRGDVRIPTLSLDRGLQLGCEMADVRAEEIALKCEQEDCIARGSVNYSDGLCRAADLARATITKPKTREQVLEEALRKIALDPLSPETEGRARNALEWKSE